ncbi:hypothetical protein F5Y17DRAFT_453431 [Xylariaceae sp. FL0594]|nr:hypothetical protein F5Y17DRAFT_453431 [Xylariaceae sp. FL0594]
MDQNGCPRPHNQDRPTAYPNRHHRSPSMGDLSRIAHHTGRRFSPWNMTTRKGGYECPIETCDTTLNREDDIERHLKSQHQNPTFFCDYPNCPRHSLAFPRKDKLKEHYISHGEFKPEPKQKQKWERCGRCLKCVVKDTGHTLYLPTYLHANTSMYRHPRIQTRSRHPRGRMHVV